LLESFLLDCVRINNAISINTYAKLSNGVKHRDKGRGKQGEATIVKCLPGSIVKNPLEN
jgi:hypothetical protein